MEKYILVTRNNIGAYVDKVNVVADLDFCKEILQAMVYANKNVINAEIIQGDRDYIGDFRVRPIHKFYMNMHRTLIMDGDYENNKS